jgi:hypothetical protein
MTADRAAENLVRMMEDTEVPFGVRAKIAQDLLDRAGVIATQVHQIIPMSEDPVMRFFEGVFSDPNNWMENPPQPAIEERVIDPDASRRKFRKPRSPSQKANQPTTRRPEWPR